MTYSQYFPYMAVLITDDNGTLRTNLDGTDPFPLEVESVTCKKGADEKAQTFTIMLNNSYASGAWGPVGKYLPYFSNLNNNVDIWIGTGSPGTHIITGTISKWRKVVENNIVKVSYEGKDITTQIMNKMINYKKYFQAENRDYAYVIRDLLNNSNCGIDARGDTATSECPNTGTLINSDKTFSGISYYDAIMQWLMKLNMIFGLIQAKNRIYLNEAWAEVVI